MPNPALESIPRPPRVAFAITAEPNPKCNAMLRLLAWSIRTNAGVLADAPIGVVYNERVDEDAARVLDRDYGVEVRSAPRISDTLRFVNKWNFVEARCVQEADWVIFLDYDTVICDDLDAVAEWMATTRDRVGAVPSIVQDHFRFDHFIRRYTDLTDAEIETSIHPWFPNRYPSFNNGVMFMHRDVLGLFRREMPEFSHALFHALSAGRSLNPLHWLRMHWNKRAWKWRDPQRWVVGPYYPKIHSQQIAWDLLILRHRMPYRVWPHIYNWRHPGTGHGPETPIRILHYLGSRYPIDRARLFDGAWIQDYAASDHAGQRALSRMVQAFNADRDAAVAAKPDGSSFSP